MGNKGIRFWFVELGSLPVCIGRTESDLWIYHQNDLSKKFKVRNETQEVRLTQPSKKGMPLLPMGKKPHASSLLRVPTGFRTSTLVGGFPPNRQRNGTRALFLVAVDPPAKSEQLFGALVEARNLISTKKFKSEDPPNCSQVLGDLVEFRRSPLKESTSIARGSAALRLASILAASRMEYHSCEPERPGSNPGTNCELT